MQMQRSLCSESTALAVVSTSSPWRPSPLLRWDRSASYNMFHPHTSQALVSRMPVSTEQTTTWGSMSILYTAATMLVTCFTLWEIWDAHNSGDSYWRSRFGGTGRQHLLHLHHPVRVHGWIGSYATLHNPQIISDSKLGFCPYGTKKNYISEAIIQHCETRRNWGTLSHCPLSKV